MHVYIVRVGAVAYQGSRAVSISMTGIRLSLWHGTPEAIVELN